MRYFLDTEFIEYAPSGDSKGTIDLISIGIVAEDGREYYAIHDGFDESKACDWVKKNVISQLEPNIKRKSMAQIAKDILEFAPPKTRPAFYAYFCNYDWVAFCWIFGSMIDLPNGYPMFCRDIKQIMHMLGLSKDDFPQQDPRTHHNALSDAHWNSNVFTVLESIVEDMHSNKEMWNGHI